MKYNAVMKYRKCSNIKDKVENHKSWDKKELD